MVGGAASIPPDINLWRLLAHGSWNINLTGLPSEF
jgi:hypothetical protein